MVIYHSSFILTFRIIDSIHFPHLYNWQPRIPNQSFTIESFSESKQIQWIIFIRIQWMIILVEYNFEKGINNFDFDILWKWETCHARSTLNKTLSISADARSVFCQCAPVVFDRMLKNTKSPTPTDVSITSLTYTKTSKWTWKRSLRNWWASRMIWAKSSPANRIAAKKSNGRWRTWRPKSLRISMSSSTIWKRKS